MNTLIGNTAPHTLLLYEGELNHLHDLLKALANLVLVQLDEAMQALQHADMVKAEDIIVRDQDVNTYELEIDAEVLVVIARQSPVARDLRTVISTSKIAVEFEKIGDEISEIARFILVLFDPKTRTPNPRLLTDIVKMANLLKLMLEKLAQLIETQDIDLAYALLEYDRECERELEVGIRHQLSFIVNDSRMIGIGLDIMQIMKCLEQCVESCRNIAEYTIYMINGIDIRHTDPAAMAKAL